MYLRFVAAVLLLVVFLFPIYWLFMIAFKTPEEIFSSPPAWYPAAIQFDNFRVLFKDGDAKTVFNSLFIAGTSTLIAMFFGTIAAYSLARFRTGGENLAVWIISQRMIPPIAIVFPLFLLYVYFGWVDTYHGLILLYTAFNLPYVIWMMRGYIEDVPLELEESALVDGCTRWETLIRVVFPMVRNGLFATRRLHVRVRLERLHLRAGDDAQRGHHLSRAGHALLRRAVELLGQDCGDVGAGRGAGIHRRGLPATLPRARHLARRGEGLRPDPWQDSG